MALSMMDIMNPRGALQRREEEQAAAQQQATMQAYNEIQGVSPALQKIAQMQLPDRERSFDQESRFGHVGTEEDYQRLFNPRFRQQAQPQDLQGIAQQAPMSPRMIRAHKMLRSGDPQLHAMGMSELEAVQADQRAQQAAAAGRAQKIADRDEGRRYARSVLEEGRGYSEGQAAAKAAAASDDGGLYSGTSMQAQNLNLLRDPNTPEEMIPAIVEQLQDEDRWTDAQGNTHIDKGMSAAAINKIRAGSAVAADNAVINKGLPAEAKKQQATLTAIDNSLATYEGLLSKYGTEYMPGAAKDELGAAHTDLLMLLKEQYNLGVLSGPDMDLLERVLVDPTALKNQGKSGDRLLNVIDKVLKPKLNAAKSTWKSQYGTGENMNRTDIPKPPAGFEVD